MIEVRCCCQPQKLMGWLPGYPKDNQYCWAIMGDSGGTSTGSLPIAKYRPVGGAPSYPAVKAEGMSMEELKQIPGFKPNLG